jgi:hypothetical protein
MGISLRDFLLGRNLERLTLRQSAILYGLTWFVVVVAVVVFRWLADVLFGWDADLESTLGIAVGMLVGASVITVVRLDRARNPAPSRIST